MPSAKPQSTTQPAPAAAPAPWQRMREHLESLRSRINDQIAAYPAPIPACDAQFNHLLEERGRIAEELGRLEACLKEAPAGQGGHEAAAAFMRSCAYIDEEAVRIIGAQAK